MHGGGGFNRRRLGVDRVGRPLPTAGEASNNGQYPPPLQYSLHPALSTTPQEPWPLNTARFRRRTGQTPSFAAAAAEDQQQQGPFA